MIKGPTFTNITFSDLTPDGLEVTVEEVPAGYDYILGNSRYEREQLCVHPRFLRRTGLKRRSQIRLVSTETGYAALYTIAHAVTDMPDDLTFLCGPDAYDKLGIAQGTFTATLSTKVVDTEISDAQAQTDGEMIEVLSDDGSQSDLIILSPHGGDIEGFTADMADTMYSNIIGGAKNASHWGLNGYVEAGYPSNGTDKWHITSVDVYPDNYPQLSTIIDRNFTYGISFHGFSGTNSVEVGGTASDTFKNDVVAAIEGAVGAEVTVQVTDNEYILGESPRNITNRLSPNDNTVQVEMTYDVRSNYSTQIANALGDHYRNNVLP